jgi:hypothetical protein
VNEASEMMDFEVVKIWLQIANMAGTAVIGA